MAFAIFNQIIPAVRPGPGSVTGGRYIPGPQVPILVRGSVQPTKGEDLKLLPEGRREEATVSVYTRDDIRNGDLLTIRGDVYEVLNVQVWDNNILPHRQALAVKMQTEGEL